MSLQWRHRLGHRAATWEATSVEGSLSRSLLRTPFPWDARGSLVLAHRYEYDPHFVPLIHLPLPEVAGSVNSRRRPNRLAYILNIGFVGNMLS